MGLFFSNSFQSSSIEDIDTLDSNGSVDYSKDDGSRYKPENTEEASSGRSFTIDKRKIFDSCHLPRNNKPIDISIEFYENLRTSEEIGLILSRNRMERLKSANISAQAVSISFST